MKRSELKDLIREEVRKSLREKDHDYGDDARNIDYANFKKLAKDLGQKLKAKYNIRVVDSNDSVIYVQDLKSGRRVMELYVDIYSGGQGSADRFYINAYQQEIPDTLVKKIKAKAFDIFQDVTGGSQHWGEKTISNSQSGPVIIGSGLFANTEEAKRKILDIANKTFTN